MRIPWLLCWCGIALLAQPSPEALMRDGHFKRARAIVEPRFAASPNDPELLYLMSWIKQQWRDLSAAQQLAEKAVAADPKNARYHLRLAESVGEEAQHASVLKQPGLARRFKKEVEATLALDPKNVQALYDIMSYYWMAPGIVGGDKNKARTIPERIGQADPVQGLFAQVRMADWDKQTEQVDGLLRKAAETFPNSFEARLSWGNRCLNSKHPEEAERQAREALRIDPTRIGGYGLLASSLALQGKWDDAEATMAQAEKTIPDDLLPYYRAGNACLNSGKEYARAERYFRKYLGQEPEPGAPSAAAAHWRLGLVFEKEGNKPSAVAALQMAIKIDPNSPAKQDLKRLK